MKPGRWKQIDELLDSALQVKPENRAAFLAEACAGDGELLREIDSLLVHYAQAGSFLETPPAEVAADFLANGRARLDEGQFVGDYKILSSIGSGGMGEVYLAQDGHLNRTIAVKVLAHAVASDPGYRHRFQEEARLASRLSHPNIVTIYGIGEERGIAYIAMEFVRGRTLRKVLSEGPMPVKTVLDLVVQIAEALSAAHAKGVVHRDLKPENVMVTSDGVVKVLDFGLARRQILADGVSTLSFMTAAGVILGTVGYMSPEQAAGKVAGHTADQFSFGVMLYEMLTRSRVFERATAVETLSAIIRDIPSALRILDAEGSSLQKVLDRCMAKDAAARYSDTMQLVNELHQIRHHWNSSAMTPVPLEIEIPEPAKPAPAALVSRRRIVWLGAATTLSAAAALIVWRLQIPDSSIRSLGVLPFVNTSDDEDSVFLSVTLRDDLVRRIAELPMLSVRLGSGPGIQGSSGDLQIAGHGLGVDAVLCGSASQQTGRISVNAMLVNVKTGGVWTRTYSGSRADLLRLQDQIAVSIIEDGVHMTLSGEDRRRLTSNSTDDDDAYRLYASAMYHQQRESESEYRAARNLLEQAIAKDEKYALAYVGLAGNYTVMAVDGYESPKTNAPLVDRYIRKAIELDANLMETHYALAADAFLFKWDWALAGKEFQIAAQSPRAWDSNSAALAYWALGRNDDALDVVKRSLKVDSLRLEWRLKEADLTFYSGRAADSEKLYEGIIRDEDKDSRAYFGLAFVKHAQSKFDAAIEELRRGWKVQAAAQNETLDESLANLLAGAKGAAGYAAIERAAAQIDLAGLAARQAEGSYVSPLDLARVHAKLQNNKEALKYLHEAVLERSPGLVFLKVDRVWDGIRTDPGFVEALQVVGLP